MTWRERVALLLGAASPFAISGPVAAQPLSPPRIDDGGAEPAVFQPLEFWGDPAHAGHLLQLAGHSSHRSHSSHSSHSSHVSGSGHASHYSGSTVTPAPVRAPAPAPVYRAPAPVYTSPARASTQTPPAARTTGATTPARAAASDARLGQDDISKFVQRVQIALLVKGYDPGPADGELSPRTRDALKAFQAASGFLASGNMDKDTLTALGVLK